MLQKYVYLYELDSVRDTDEEIITGQKAIYREIVEYGNTVVLTFNQFVDSRGFFSLFDGEEYRNNLISLFEKGCIRISQYGDTRTLVQYLLNSIEESKQFIYSALPLKFTQRRLTALLRRSLAYSDLSEIQSYLKGTIGGESAIRELFEEVHDGTVTESSLSKGEMMEILTNLYHLLSVVLRLSPEPQIYICPKNPEELHGFHFRDYLHAAMLLSYPQDPLWNRAVRCLQAIISISGNNRSVYLRELKQAYEEQKTADPVSAQSERLAYCYAEAIVNLCYNYACEASICNTSKHYCIAEILHPENGMPSSQADFRLRLEETWHGGINAAHRFLKEESNVFLEFKDVDRIPNFRRAIRLLSYGKKSREDADRVAQDGVPRYEFQQELQGRQQKRKILAAVGKGLLLSLVCILLACLVELAMTAAQNLFDAQWDTSKISFQIWDTLLFLYLTEAITSLLNRKINWLLPLSEGLRSLGQLLADGWITLRNKIQKPEKARCTNVRESEPVSAFFPIRYVRTEAMTAYLNFKSNPASSHAFGPCAAYPIADLQKVSVLQQMTRQEELLGVHYGLIYRSIYHTVLVDPVLDSQGVLYPYERILPTEPEDGVVIIPEINGKYILITQYRHALRTTQTGFPRGFSNLDEAPSESALRELSEELHALPASPPALLGRIVPDSGSTSERASVFLVSLSSWSLQTGHEGIVSAKALSLQELIAFIKEGRIEDGFTLGAVALLQAVHPDLTPF